VRRLDAAFFSFFPVFFFAGRCGAHEKKGKKAASSRRTPRSHPTIRDGQIFYWGGIIDRGGAIVG
jgi:hypothetical protein